MIKKISLENFKLFNDKNDFDSLRRLNILTGINGRGKSSLLHSLVVLYQSLSNLGDLKQLCLNGNQVKLGTALDIKNISSGREKPTRFWLKDEESELVLSYSFPEEKAPYLNLDSITLNGENIDISNREKWESQSIIAQIRNLIFISAERIGPKLSYEGNNDTSFVGSCGEFVACALYHHKDDILDPSLIEIIPDYFPEVNPEEIDRSIIGIVQFWMSKMFRSVSIDVDYVDDTNAYTLKFSNISKTGKFKPTNVGFGYSYALPIIVAGILAKKGSILVIENPEAHLHPMAQSILGKFIVWVTQKDVQVIAETHSEHILNAPRVMTAQDAYNCNDLSVLYFDELLPQGHTSIEIEPSGRIKDWPKGFFDQMEKDNDIILQL